MTDAEPIDYVVDEVDEFLGAGRVGLYEFVDMLRGRAPGLAVPEMQRVARAALDRLLDEGAVQLEWQRWGDPSFAHSACVDDVVPGAWLAPTEDPYLVVIPR